MSYPWQMIDSVTPQAEILGLPPLEAQTSSRAFPREDAEWDHLEEKLQALFQKKLE